MTYYIVDVFTDSVFSGGPTAVFVMEEWLPEAVMQGIAMENGFSETAFAVPEGEGYRLRWFTPDAEIDLCGYATLAAGYVIMAHYQPAAVQVRFRTLSGVLTVSRQGELYAMDLPALRPEPYALTPRMEEALGAVPAAVYKRRDLTFLFDSEEQVRSLRPDLEKLKQFPEGLGVFVTAPSSDPRYDFVSRAFWPKMGIGEDPVCGAAHCNLTPLWSERLGKKRMVAHQISRRGGVFTVEDRGERVMIAGKVALFATGDLAETVYKKETAI